MRSWLGVVLLCIAGIARAAEPSAAWPASSKECKPWVRWFWMGSAVEPGELTRQLQQYAAAGIGGVEIYPVYGVRGAESRSLEFLSPQWMRALDHTIAEAHRLGMGVDMTCGTGWPFGGPNVGADDAAWKVEIQILPVDGGLRVTHGYGRRPLALAVSSDDASTIDLSGQVGADGNLDWVAPPGNWKLYALLERPTRQKVKRPAPGGAGLVLDPFRAEPIRQYLKRFDAAFGPDAHGLRAFFNDSYEVYGADWTTSLLDEFKRRRGYDLRGFLPAFAGKGDPDRGARVRCDYRETIAGLLLDGFTRNWVDWCHGKRALARDQAHGSPGNLLDLYSTADVPETESFGPGPVDVAFSKFASSAAHLRGQTLASAEACTWLDEHFRVTPTEIKHCVDGLFLAGINHLVLQGAAYSPASAPWPGWLFYASVDFGPTGGLWHDLPSINAYLTRCQSFLQLGQPDEDLLLYHPIHDLWMGTDSSDGRLEFLRIHNAEQWLHRLPVGEAAKLLLERGYSFDYVSDHSLLQAKGSAAGIELGGRTYRAVIIPRCRYIPVETMEHLAALARAGGTVLVQGPLPADVPGLHDLENRRKRLKDLLAAQHFESGTSLRKTQIGNGQLLVGDEIPNILAAANVRREACADHDISFVRRRDPDGSHYFLLNRGKVRFDGWLPISQPAAAGILFDCYSGACGLAATRAANHRTEVYLQLEPGQSVVLRTLSAKPSGPAKWQYLELSEIVRPLSGEWTLHFVEGGPHLPQDAKLTTLKSWTLLKDSDTASFSGTAHYTLHFDKPVENAAAWLLDLSEVHETARVTLNGESLGVVWHPPYRFRAENALRRGDNVLEIEVTNLAANRIADLDRRNVQWKIFQDINFVNLDYKPFNASGWSPLPSGLIGPVRLIACRDTSR